MHLPGTFVLKESVVLDCSLCPCRGRYSGRPFTSRLQVMGGAVRQRTPNRKVAGMTMNQATSVSLFVAVTVLVTEPARGQIVIQPRLGDSSVVALIPTVGAIVEFSGIVRVYFPTGAFARPESVTVWITDNPSTDRGAVDYDLGDGGRPPYLPNDVAIRATIRPRTVVDVEFTMPESGLRCVSHRFAPRVFREFTGGGLMEALTMYDPLPSTANDNDRTLTAHIAPTVGDGPVFHEELHVGCFRMSNREHS